MAPNTEKKGIRTELSYANLHHAYDHDDEGIQTEISKESVQIVLNTVNEHFPDALASHTLAFQLEDILSHHDGFSKETTILGTSFASDDVCRDLEDELRGVFDNNYQLGGLAGFCFSGVAGITDLFHHIPESGNALIVYGPHVGVDWDGTIGKVNRRGHTHGSSVCSALATAAATAIASRPPATVIDMTNAQQSFIEQQLGQHAERLRQTKNLALELPHVLLECQDKLMEQIVTKALDQLPKHGRVALVGGIQVNTPEGTAEYFCPKSFVIYDRNGDKLPCMVQELRNSVKNTAGW